MQIIKKPVIAENVFIAPGAIVYGDVTLMNNVSVWFHAIVRAETGSIVIGSDSNIQDGCVLHVDQDADVIIGNQVTIGHNATIHGCSIGDNTLIGMGAIIMNHAVIGKNCIVAAGALVTQNMIIPDNSLVMGNPAKIRRDVTQEEISHNQQNACHYISQAAAYAQIIQYNKK
ncbi:gamma carbonic anhydrase family protein [Lachnospiraceae bacterium]|nr:gamma carbonic anhydrase family protein [Lachnospiraceae bacterium]